MRAAQRAWTASELPEELRTWCLVLAAYVALASGSPAIAGAQDAYGCIDRLPDAAVRYRLDYVRRGLLDARPREMAWWIGWMTFNAGSVVASAIGFVKADLRSVRDTWLMQGVGSAIFVLTESAVPLTGLSIRRKLRRLPEATPEERRAKLLAATRWLERDVSVTSSQRTAFAHIGGWAFAGLSTAYVARHKEPGHELERRNSLIIQFVTTAAGAELTLLTVPRRAERTWERYRSFACSDPTLGAPDPIDDGGVEPDARALGASRGARPQVFYGFGFGQFFVSGTF